MDLQWVITFEAGLSFLGLGVGRQPRHGVSSYQTVQADSPITVANHLVGAVPHLYYPWIYSIWGDACDVLDQVVGKEARIMEPTLRVVDLEVKYHTGMGH
jgi:hypothetical protein